LNCSPRSSSGFLLAIFNRAEVPSPAATATPVIVSDTSATIATRGLALT
jgi:hypothetical protein